MLRIAVIVVVTLLLSSCLASPRLNTESETTGSSSLEIRDIESYDEGYQIFAGNWVFHLWRDQNTVRGISGYPGIESHYYTVECDLWGCRK